MKSLRANSKNVNVLILPYCSYKISTKLCRGAKSGASTARSARDCCVCKNQLRGSNEVMSNCEMFQSTGPYRVNLFNLPRVSSHSPILRYARPDGDARKVRTEHANPTLLVGHGTMPGNLFRLRAPSWCAASKASCCFFGSAECRIPIRSVLWTLSVQSGSEECVRLIDRGSILNIYWV